MSEDVYLDPTEEPKSYGDPEPSRGTLLEEKDKLKVARKAAFIWESKDTLMRRRLAKWRVNELRRSGYKNVTLKTTNDDRSWIAYIPPHLERAPDAISSMNKAAALCRKFVSLMFADPPASEALPSSGEDEDRDAAEFATRVLADVEGPDKCNSVQNGMRAFDRASTFGSGFVYHYVNPRGGGRIPLQVYASPMAQTVEDALIDPETGMEWPDLTERFVRKDGSLTDDKAEAAHRAVPSLEERVLTGRNVRMIPHSAEDISQAYGVQVGLFMTYGELKQKYPKELGKLSEEVEDRLFDYKPKHPENMITGDQKRSLDRKPEDKDDRLVWTLTTYYKDCEDYPKGAIVVTVGNHLTVEREEWCFTDDEGLEHCLPLPITQYKQWDEGDPDPYGFGAMDLIGEGNEVRSGMLAALEDHIDALLNRKTFIPMYGNLSPKDLGTTANKYIYTIPGSEPKTEDIPSFPNDGMKLYEISSTEMEDTMGLGSIAQGLESAQVQSGRHAQAIISQVHAGLSEIRLKIENAWVRSGEIRLALVRANFDAPIRIGWVGEDGAYKEKRWTGADLRQTSDVRLARGSLTMLSPVAKAQLLEQQYQMGTMTQEEFTELTVGQIGYMIGMQDNPFLMRIRRQIYAWQQGPPEEWEPQMTEQPVVDPATGQPMVDQMGQPQMEQVQVMDPVLGAMWEPVPADDEPYPALTRLREISKMMARSEYMTKPQPWRFALEQEFQRAKMASMGQTPGAPQVGQPPAQQQSPAQRTQGPLAQPETPLPQDTGPVQVQ